MGVCGLGVLMGRRSSWHPLGPWEWVGEDPTPFWGVGTLIRAGTCLPGPPHRCQAASGLCLALARVCRAPLGHLPREAFWGCSHPSFLLL